MRRLLFAPKSPVLVQRRGVREFIKFSVVGLSSTAVDKGSLWLLLRAILPGVPWGISATLSYSLGVINGFLWNRRWTFRAREHGSTGLQFLRFLSTNVVGLLLNLGATKALLSVVIGASRVGGNPMPRQVVMASLGAIPLVTVWNFSASKYWAFRRLSPPARVASPAGNSPGAPF
jgi:putative flippase GtrA